MPRFQFRFEPLLTVRQSARDQRRAELAAALSAERQAAERREAAEAALDAEHTRMRSDLVCGPVDVSRLATSSRYAAVLRARIDNHAVDERAAAALVERCRDALLEADRGVRVLEKLRERQLEQFQFDQRAAEIKRLDEIAASATRREAA